MPSGARCRSGLASSTLSPGLLSVLLWMFSSSSARMPTPPMNLQWKSATLVGHSSRSPTKAARCTTWSAWFTREGITCTGELHARPVSIFVWQCQFAWLRIQSWYLDCCAGIPRVALGMRPGNSSLTGPWAAGWLSATKYSKCDSNRCSGSRSMTARWLATWGDPTCGEWPPIGRSMIPNVALEAMQSLSQRWSAWSTFLVSLVVTRKRSACRATSWGQPKRKTVEANDWPHFWMCNQRRALRIGPVLMAARAAETLAERTTALRSTSWAWAYALSSGAWAAAVLFGTRNMWADDDGSPRCGVISNTSMRAKKPRCERNRHRDQ